MWKNLSTILLTKQILRVKKQGTKVEEVDPIDAKSVLVYKT